MYIYILYIRFLCVFVVSGDCAADVVFIVDSSATIGLLNWFTMKQFVMDIVQGLMVGVSIILGVDLTIRNNLR